MTLHASPLRYPGGKADLTDFLAATLKANRFGDATYVEAFAGGAGAALTLLFRENVSRIVLNDRDPRLIAFWRCVLNEPERLARRVRQLRPSVERWKRERNVLKRNKAKLRDEPLDVAMAFLIINRCSRSGLLHGSGPIGGYDQRGTWKIDARYNPEGLVERIERIAQYRERISIYSMDAIRFLETLAAADDLDHSKSFLYLDPPYYEQGERLYSYFFRDTEHRALANHLNAQNTFRWLISYDDHPAVHAMYATRTKNVHFLSYHAHRTKVGRELIIASADCELPPFDEALVWADAAQFVANG